MSYIDIVVEKHFDGWTAKQIHDYLKEIFKDKTAFSTITKKIRCLSFGDLVGDENEKEEIRLYFQNIRLVEKCTQINPNSSIRNISEETRIPPTSVYRYLTKHLKYICLHLRWIPHELSKELRKTRIEYSKKLLSLLQQDEKNNFHFIGTGDESWFSYSFDPTTQWVQQGEKPDTKVRKSLHTQKVMIIIFWNIDGIQVLDCVDPSQRVNREYFVQNILEEIVKSESFIKAKTQKQKFVLHMDNAPIHRSKLSQSFLKKNESLLLLTNPTHQT